MVFATKYLPHYLGQRRELSASKELTLERLCETIVDHWEHQPLMRTQPNLKIKRFIGRSENVVTIEMLTAMIAYLLLRLARITTPCKLSLQQIARRISLNLTSRCSQIELFSDPPEKTRVCLLQSPAHLALVMFNRTAVLNTKHLSLILQKVFSN